MGEGENVRLHHWLYGVTLGIGYGTKAVSKGLNTSLYESKLKGHLTPIRGEAVQGDGSVDMRMIHPVGAGEEILLSALGKGPRDEEGRPTFQNHSVIVPTTLLKEGRLSFAVLDQAIRDNDLKNPSQAGVMELMELPLLPADGGYRPGRGIRQQMNRAAVETLASRRMGDAYGRTLVLMRGSTPQQRNTALYLLYELLNFRCEVPFFTASSDAPTTPTLNFFNLLIASRGIRADNSWVLLDAALEKAAVARVAKKEAVYKQIEEAFAQEAGSAL
jgi:hypothetical protein